MNGADSKAGSIIEEQIVEQPKKMTNMMGYLMGLMGQKVEVNTFELAIDEKPHVQKRVRTPEVKRRKKDMRKARQARKNTRGWA
jgi:hypothetical protein